MKSFKKFNSVLSVATLTAISFLIADRPSFTQAATEELETETKTIKGIIRDFKSNHPDFERNPGDTSADGSVFGFGLDTEITTNFLGEDGKPVYKGGSNSTTTKDNFDQWFNDVEGVNKSMEFSITLTDEDGDGTYTYARDLNESKSFFPIDGKLFGNENNPHNYHFTYELEDRFTYEPGTATEPRIFTFKGDDDVYVYIDGKKVIDLGGVHSQEEESVNLDEQNLVAGETYTLKLFFAERHIVQSNFRIDTNVEFFGEPEQIVFAD